MITSDIIRKRLTEAIELSGKSRTEIAKEIGVKQPVVSQYVAGKIFPSLDTFANLCEVLDVDPAYILGLKNNIERG